MNGFLSSFQTRGSREGFVHEVAAVCVLTGKILLQNGAETFRVEDTMNRIAKSYAVHDAQSFVTPTGIIFSIEDHDVTQLVRINQRGTNLRKVTQVNTLSRRVALGEVSIKELHRLLRQIDHSEVAYSNSLQILAAAIASSCFLLMFLGQWQDLLPAFLAGGAGQAGMIYFHKLAKVKFFSEFMSSIIIGLIALFSVKLGIGLEMNKIIIGAVMPLVPGVPITNAVRDIMSGDLVAGLSKSAEAGLTAFAIGIGVTSAIMLG
ncbi:threonine/serine exporter family protein [Sporolactobacillus laevolacticus]|uniref:threonine/serine exporter family protein n=1 Tax=Sporolactobacillus laevolacticus TaxID=33018 RepID=UPI0025B3B798|nr:threonine/serine exporter family protein [Sporolactobacillus laevolacticus]MDN3956863.1 threonine/serine exporter family protein [Sporolactobacillus laevolacticus]